MSALVFGVRRIGCSHRRRRVSAAAAAPWRHASSSRPLFGTTRLLLEPFRAAPAGASGDAQSTQPAGVGSVAAQVAQRLKWEDQVQTAFRSADIDTARHRHELYNKYYVNSRFTTLLQAFPLLDHKRWRGVQPLDLTRAPAPAHDGAEGEGGSSRGEQKQEGAAIAGDATLSHGTSGTLLQPPNPHVVRVAVLGAPNAGKSTLFNAIVSSRVSAESHKEGATAQWVKGVTIVHNTQLLLLDTPGIYHMGSKTKKERHLDRTFLSWDAIKSAQVVLLCVPVGLSFVDNEQKATIREVAHRAAMRRLPVALALTMMDRVTSGRSLDAYRAFRSDLAGLGIEFAQVFETSAFRSRGLIELKDFAARYGKPQKWEASATAVTTQSPPDVAFQLLRQACFSALPHVVPHRMRMKIFGWTHEPDGALEIAVELLFDNEAFMATFFGKMYEVREKARRELARELNHKVRLIFFPYLSQRKFTSS